MDIELAGRTVGLVSVPVAFTPGPPPVRSDHAEKDRQQDPGNDPADPPWKDIHVAPSAISIGTRYHAVLSIKWPR